MPALTSKQISVYLKTVPNWSKRARTIHRTFECDGFLNSIAFVNRIAKRAQKINHHPDIDVRFNKVTLTLTTHDETKTENMKTVNKKIPIGAGTEIHGNHPRPFRGIRHRRNQSAVEPHKRTL